MFTKKSNFKFPENFYKIFLNGIHFFKILKNIQKIHFVIDKIFPKFVPSYLGDLISNISKCFNGFSNFFTKILENVLKIFRKVFKFKKKVQNL